LLRFYASSAVELPAVNKCDIADPWPSFPGAVMISAKTGQGLEELKAKIAEALQEDHAPVTFRIPFSQYGMISQIRALGRVLSETYTDEGTELVVMAARDDVRRMAKKPEFMSLLV